MTPHLHHCGIVLYAETPAARLAVAIQLVEQISARCLPIPRVLLSVSLIVWRVPNETSVESVARISDAEMSPMAAARAGSRASPSVTSRRLWRQSVRLDSAEGAGGETRSGEQNYWDERRTCFFAC